jgi:hypothetical protein
VLVTRAACDGGSLGAWEGVLGGADDVGRCLTYIGKSLGFVLGFRVDPWINRLVGANGPGKRECNRIEKRAMVRKSTGPCSGIEDPRAKGSFKSFLIF